MELPDLLNMMLGADNMIYVSMGVLGLVSACVVAKEYFCGQKYTADKKEPSRLEQISEKPAEKNYQKQENA